MPSTTLNIPLERIMTVTEARRNFSKVIKETLDKGDFVLTKDGKPIVKVVPLKREPREELTVWDKLKDFYGVWANTDLDNDKLWNDILVKERKLGTRKKRVRL